ncbi:MAG: hypothetical protein V4553_22320 [Bacteroidota bacterium]
MIPNVPEDLLLIIRDFLVKACKKGETVWKNFAHEEDSITGAFLSKFETDKHYERIGKERWEWNVDYFKFKSKGLGAFEKAHGTDGIFQIIVKDKFDKIVFRKGLLFQAKKINGSLSDLKGQITKIEKLASLSSVAFVYGPNGFKATKGTDIIDNDITSKNNFLFEKDISTIIAHDFIDCTIGKIDLFFDYDQDRLFLIDEFGLKKRVISLNKPKQDVEIQIKQLR